MMKIPKSLFPCLKCSIIAISTKWRIDASKHWSSLMPQALWVVSSRMSKILFSSTLRRYAKTWKHLGITRKYSKSRSHFTETIMMVTKFWRFPHGLDRIKNKLSRILSTRRQHLVAQISQQMRQWKQLFGTQTKKSKRPLTGVNQCPSFLW
jgi:hypothetical protein